MTGDDSRPTALVTGGSRGIGRALAAEFAADDYDLVLAARDADRLETAATELGDEHGVDVTALAADLSDPDAPEAVYEQATAGGRTVDALVNNAGTATYGPFAETDREGERAQVRVNVVAPLELTRLALPGMVGRDEGLVVFVASTAAFRPGPWMAGYHASKAYLLSLSESIAMELRGTGVRVSAFCPGPVRTDIHDRSGRGSTWLERRFMRSPEAVAAEGYERAAVGETVIVPGLRFRLLARSFRFVPRSLARRLSPWVVARGPSREP